MMSPANAAAHRDSRQAARDVQRPDPSRTRAWYGRWTCPPLQIVGIPVDPANALLSRSRRRKRGAESWGKASVICCAVHAAVGESLTLKCNDVVLEEGSPGLRGRFRATRHEPTNRAL